jgi:Uncharacterised nucleotidyltransferase
MRLVSDRLPVEVLTAVRRSLGLRPDEALSSAELVSILRRDKFPLLWMAPDARSEGSDGNAVTVRAAGRDGRFTSSDLSLLESKEFRDGLDEDRLRYAHLHGEYVRLAEKWASAGIRPICFKSAGIAPSFPYAGDDVDILVPVFSAEKARQVLAELGYLATNTDNEKLNWQFRHSAPGRTASASIHLHARLGGADGFVLDDEVWLRARQSCDDPWTWIPGPEDVVLITVSHALLQKRAISLRSLVRIRHALRNGTIDWAYLDHVATERGWRTGLHLALTLLAHLEHGLFGSSTVPPDQRERYERTLRTNVWWRRYWESIQRRSPVLPFHLSSNAHRLLLLEKLCRDRHLPRSQKAARAVHVVAGYVQQRSGFRWGQNR